MDQPEIEATETYTVYVEQATGDGWETVYTYRIDKGLILPAHEALRALRDFVSDTYRGRPVACQARVCDGTEAAAVLSLQIS